jgi:hypothetical protein
MLSPWSTPPGSPDIHDQVGTQDNPLLLLMANGSAMATANSDRLCWIVLEWFTSKGKAINRNLDEQAYHFENDICDPGMIARAYFEPTRKFQATATVMWGLSDQEAVRQ